MIGRLKNSVKKGYEKLSKMMARKEEAMCSGGKYLVDKYYDFSLDMIMLSFKQLKESDILNILVQTVQCHLPYIFSSPEHVLMVSYCDQSLSVVRALSSFCFKQLLLQNGLTDFEIILQEGSLGDPLPKLLRLFCSVEQDGRQS